MAKFLVETYSIHKLQYVVECDSAETAQTEVACNTEDLIDLHQEHLDEKNLLYIEYLHQMLGTGQKKVHH